MNQPLKTQKTIIQSTLSEYEQVQHRILRTGMLGREVMDFLQLDDLNIVKEVAMFPAYDLPQIHRAIARCFPGWRLIKSSGHGWHRDFWAPEFVELTTGTGDVDCFMSEGVMYFEAENGNRRVVLVENHDKNSDPGMIRLVLICASAKHNQLRLEYRRLFDEVKKSDHCLQGTAIRPNGRLLVLDSSVSLDDVALTPKIRTAIDENVIGFFRQRKRFQQLGLPQSRGVILYGAPGNGKTMIGKALAASKIATFIQASPNDLYETGIRATFEMARRLSPTILFLEDVDFIAGGRRRRPGSEMLGELLVQLDGIEENDGVVVIATTNDIEALDSAIKERPSRFDVLLRIDNPKTEQRGKIIRKFAAGLMNDTIVDQIVTMTDGMSGAQTKELCIRVAQTALLNTNCNEDASITESDLLHALSTLSIQKPKQVVGFATSNTENNDLIH